MLPKKLKVGEIWQIIFKKGNFRQNIESMSPLDEFSPEKKRLINLFLDLC